jgi:cation transport regulator ChaC
MTSYVFGYGSLLGPARTRGHWRLAGARDRHQRGWFHQFADNVGSTCTYLGAERTKDHTINGAVYRVNDIEATKQRETGYTAVQLTADEFVMLDGGGPLKVGGDVNV